MVVQRAETPGSAYNMTAGELLVSVWPPCSAPLNSMLGQLVLLDLDFVKKKSVFSVSIPFLFSYFIALASSPTEVVALTASLCLVVDVNVLTVCSFFFLFWLHCMACGILVP